MNAGATFYDPAFAARSQAAHNASRGLGTARGFLTHPYTLAAGAVLGTGAAINAVAGNPIGNWIDSWDGTNSQPQRFIADAGQDIYNQQLQDSVNVAERAAKIKRLMEARKAEQAFRHQMVAQDDTQTFQAQQAREQLQATQANQILNAYLAQVGKSVEAAQVAGSMRYY